MFYVLVLVKIYYRSFQISIAALFREILINKNNTRRQYHKCHISNHCCHLIQRKSFATTFSWICHCTVKLPLIKTKDNLLSWAINNLNLSRRCWMARLGQLENEPKFGGKWSADAKDCWKMYLSFSCLALLEPRLTKTHFHVIRLLFMLVVISLRDKPASRKLTLSLCQTKLLKICLSSCSIQLENQRISYTGHCNQSQKKTITQESDHPLGLKTYFYQWQKEVNVIELLKGKISFSEPLEMAKKRNFKV